jgi:hypothetical protein
MLTRLLERMAEPGEEAEGGEKSAGTS